MKTKFIKNTNKQYSIREDGEVINHKKDIFLKKSHNSVSLRINKKNHNVSIRNLLWMYFKLFYCIHCKMKCNEKLNKEGTSFVCGKCWSKKKKERNDRYRTKYPNKDHAGAKRLLDSYVVRVLEYKLEDNIPQHIIKAKRQQILLHREIKQQFKF